jgi:hypothetical protein
MIYDLRFTYYSYVYVWYVVLISFPWEGGFHILMFETVPYVG